MNKIQNSKRRCSLRRSAAEKERHYLAIPYSAEKTDIRYRMMWTFSTAPLAYNEPGKEPKVVISEKTVLGLTSKLSVLAYSVSIFELEIE